jgi:hypothetical protein
VEVRNVMQVEMKGMPGRATLYDIQGIGAPYHIRLRDKSETLEKMPANLEVQVYHLKDKIVTGATSRAWVTHLCDTAALVETEGKLEPWDDVRLIFFDDRGQPYPGHVYGKVTRVDPLEGGRCEGLISFTSVPPEVFQDLRKTREVA